MLSQSKHRTYRWFVVVVVTLFVWGCFEGAPHSNPLDPRSDNFENAGAIAGTVTSFYAPFNGLGNAEIRLSPGGRLAVTDVSGRFDFVNIEPGQYILTAELPGYASITDTVQVLINEQEVVTFRMDGLPVVLSADLQTFHLTRWWPPPVDQYWLDITVRVTDPDGVTDIESVFIDIPAFGLVDTLQSQSVPGHFAKRLREIDLGASVQALAGHDINLIVRDRVGEEARVLGQRITRILGDPPNAIEPLELNPASSNPPVFFWESVLVNFPFTYQVDISRVDESIPTLIQTIPGIPSDSLSVQGLSALQPGQYFWTVSIVDEFGNQSRSREAGFIIQ